MAPPTDPYDGPLDLLLEEVRRQRVAIERIAMAPIVARFLEYMRTAARRNLALDIEWLHMAATLIEWKSLALLPSAAEESPADPIRDEVVRQLRAHRKRAAADLDARQSVEGARFSRVTEPAVVEALPKPASFVTVWDMIEQARDLGRWAEEHRQARRQWHAAWDVQRDDVSVAGMSEFLRLALERGGGKLDGRALLGSQESLARRSCLFLAMLEMSRAGECEVTQNELFGTIWLAVSVRHDHSSH